MLSKIKGLRSPTRKIRKVGKLRTPRAISSPEPMASGLRLRKVTDAEKLEAAAMQGQVGTLPERIVWKWLEAEQYEYQFQLAELGGRDTAGGAVIDFVVYGVALAPIVIRVMGDYWHGPQFPQTQAKDDEQYVRLHAMGYFVVDAWEHDIYEAVLKDSLTPYMEDLLYNAA